MSISSNEILIIIPTYNEVDNITSLVSEVFSRYPKIHILIVDDNSHDGTKEALIALKSQFKNLITINRTKRLGLGSAYREGFLYAKSRKYLFVIQMDGDGSHRVEDLKKLIEAQDKYDLVVGSRYVKDGKILGWKLSRKLISKFGNIFSRKLLKLNTIDSTSGFKRLSNNIFESHSILSSNTNGYSFQVEIIHYCERTNLHILEIPISFIDRRFGSSKFNTRIILEAFFNIIMWSINKQIKRL